MDTIKSVQVDAKIPCLQLLTTKQKLQILLALFFFFPWRVFRPALRHTLTQHTCISTVCHTIMCCGAWFCWKQWAMCVFFCPFLWAGNPFKMGCPIAVLQNGKVYITPQKSLLPGGHTDPMESILSYWPRTTMELWLAGLRQSGTKHFQIRNGSFQILKL